MNVEERLKQALAETADSVPTTQSGLETIIIRGRRRRFVHRMVLAGSSGAAIVVAVVMTATFANNQAIQDPAAPDLSQADPNGAIAVESGGDTRFEGDLIADDRGYLADPANSASSFRLLEAHSDQVDGSVLFGPAISDDHDGFLYTVSDVVEGDRGRRGWVLWVPAGAEEPIVLAEEPTSGVGELLGIVRDGGNEYAVYTTVAGRSPMLRRVKVTKAVSTPLTIVDTFGTGDAANNRVVAVSLVDGCSVVDVLDAGGTVLPTVRFSDSGCVTIDTPTLSADGEKLAYIERRGESNSLTVVAMDTGTVDLRVELESRQRITAFDGATVALTSNLEFEVATNQRRTADGRLNDIRVLLNDRLLLQLPDVDGATTFEQATSRLDPSFDVGDEVSGENASLFDQYAAAGWAISIEPDPAAGSTPVDLDAFGVTVSGLGPFVVGETAQTIADVSGHKLMALNETDRCRLMILSPILGTTRADVQLTVEDDKLVGMQFDSKRFNFNGVSVGSPLSDAQSKLPDATASMRDSVSVLTVVDGGTTVEFIARNDIISTFAVRLTASTCN